MANNHGGPRASNVIGVGQVPRGQPYGTGAQQERALSVVPLSGKQPSPSAMQQTQPGIQPGQIPSLDDPTARPDEPITAGLPIGPGEGPSALGIAPQAPVELRILRQMYARSGNEDVRRLIEWTESNL